jgi:hypothetical protein
VTSETKAPIGWSDSDFWPTSPIVLAAAGSGMLDAEANSAACSCTNEREAVAVGAGNEVDVDRGGLDWRQSTLTEKERNALGVSVGRLRHSVGRATQRIRAELLFTSTKNITRSWHN